MSEQEYDPADDAMKSYYAAVEAKRLRGDTRWPTPLRKGKAKEAAE